MLVINEKIPMSLYVHIPWCVRKCPYCDFNSHVVKGELPEKNYIECLTRDLAFNLEYFNVKRPLQTIFIGGGTGKVAKVVHGPGGHSFFLRPMGYIFCMFPAWGLVSKISR